MPEDDTELQGLLENEHETFYPDSSTELLGVELKVEERTFTLVSDKPKVNFCELAGVARIASMEPMRLPASAAAEDRRPAIC